MYSWLSVKEHSLTTNNPSQNDRKTFNYWDDFSFHDSSYDYYDPMNLATVKFFLRLKRLPDRIDMSRSNFKHEIWGVSCLGKTFHYASPQFRRSTCCKCSIYPHNLRFYCLNFFSFEYTEGTANPGLIGPIFVSQVASTYHFDIDISPWQLEKPKYHKAVH